MSPGLTRGFFGHERLTYSLGWAGYNITNKPPTVCVGSSKAGLSDPPQDMDSVAEDLGDKTTLARMLLRLIEPDSGEIQLDGQDLLALSGERCGRGAGRCR